jgi:hypothetical protein
LKLIGDNLVRLVVSDFQQIGGVVRDKLLSKDIEIGVVGENGGWNVLVGEVVQIHVNFVCGDAALQVFSQGLTLRQGLTLDQGKEQQGNRRGAIVKLHRSSTNSSFASDTSCY